MNPWTLFLAAAVQTTSPGTPDAGTFHLDPAERAAVQRSLEKGTAWLLAARDESGAFRTGKGESVCEVALSALALWAVTSAAGSSLPREHCELSSQYLLSWRQPDGGLYDPDRGLAVYTSGVAAHTVAALARVLERPELEVASREIELFAYRRGVPESWTDDVEVAASASRLDASALQEALARPDLPAAERRALQFLEGSRPERQRQPGRTKVPEWRPAPAQSEEFCYEDLLPLVYETLRPEHQRTMRALRSLRQSYTLEFKPDWTRRLELEGSTTPSQGIFYYYCVLARLLEAQQNPIFRTEDGSRHDWPRELGRKLLSLQRTDGSWVNRDVRWWEDQPVLATSYALLALSICRDMKAAP